jgi:hypothetical protein
MTNGIVHSLLSHACYLPQILPRHRFHLLLIRQERGQPSSSTTTQQGALHSWFPSAPNRSTWADDRNPLPVCPARRLGTHSAVNAGPATCSENRSSEIVFRIFLAPSSESIFRISDFVIRNANLCIPELVIGNSNSCISELVIGNSNSCISEFVVRSIVIRISYFVLGSS